MTKFEFIRTNTGELRIPDNINRAITTALANGYRLQMMKLPGTGEASSTSLGGRTSLFRTPTR
jgi:hypothetical protein